MSKDEGAEKESRPANAVSQADPTKVKTGASLNGLCAAIRSFFDRPLDFYPRLETRIRSVSSDEILKRFGVVMDPWSTLESNDTKLDKAIDLAKASLQEAKAQTEYQDQKATRLLTVSTFLTALAGALYITFSSNYPLQTLSQQTSGYWFLLATHFAFFLFILLSLVGALVTFHASRTRFKYPSEATVRKQSDKARSYLFFREMIAVTPEGWAKSFVTVADLDGEETATLNPKLKIEYLKNYVSEAYLIAAKTADKLRYLQPAQSLLSYALRVLMVYILLLAYVVMRFPSTNSTTLPTEVKTIIAPTPVEVLVEQPLAPATVLKPNAEAHQ